MLTEQQVEHFVRFGYVILKNAAEPSEVENLRALIDAQLGAHQAPFELEADVHYPGAPLNKDAVGGQTVRRLLNAYSRHGAYTEWAEKPLITDAVKCLLNTGKLYISPNHHNCIMTKQPAFSSRTGWHRDTRYWHFTNKYLINSWLAIGDEKAENGGMLILPGSHRWDIDVNSLDDAQFLIEDHPSNTARLTLAKQVDLNAGDCLLFSAHCFHAAGANMTDKRKFSLVFTYHGETTESLPDTKSSVLPSIQIS